MSDSWKAFEILVAKIQAQLAPDATIEHNARIRGRHSGVMRQIDVLVRQSIGQYEMTIVLDCKDYAEPVDVKGVEEFSGLVRDVGSNKAAMVCPKGFTPAAKAVATSLQIDLYSPIDTDPHKWQVRISAPLLCDFRSTRISFGLEFSAPMPCRIGDGFWNMPAFDREHHPLGSPYDKVVDNWNSGAYPIEPGVHEKQPIFNVEPVLLDNGYGSLAPFKLYVALCVERDLYFGHLPIERISGFRDELSGGIITNALTTGIFDPIEVAAKWEKIESP